MTTARKLPACQRMGTATIEFTFVAIPFFLLIFACIEFARVGMIEAMCEDAAFRSARLVMVTGSTKAEAVTEANRVLSQLGVTASSVEVEPFGRDGGLQGEISDDTVEITVTVTVDMADHILFLGAFTKSIELEKTCTIGAERYKGYYDGGAGT